MVRLSSETLALALSILPQLYVFDLGISYSGGYSNIKSAVCKEQVLTLPL